MLNSLLRKARIEVFTYGRILTDTAALLMAHGCIVGPLEQRLIHELAGARQ